MLHADMSMLKNYTVSGELDTPSCTEVKDCPDADTKEIVGYFITVALWNKLSMNATDCVGYGFEKSTFLETCREAMTILVLILWLWFARGNLWNVWIINLV